MVCVAHLDLMFQTGNMELEDSTEDLFITQNKFRTMDDSFDTQVVVDTVDDLMNMVRMDNQLNC